MPRLPLLLLARPTIHLKRPASQLNIPSILLSPPRRSLSTMAPIPATAKVVQIDQNGGVDVLQYRDAPIPALEPGQILVRNQYAGVNYIDTYIRSGLYPTPKFPRTLGNEGAGEVVAVADDSGPVKVGSRVVYMGPVDGAYAQFTRVPAAKAVVVPQSIGTDQAAAVHLQGLTAWTIIREAGQIQAGQWTLVHAAAGGVGLLLVQLLSAVGAKVIATASTEEKLALARSHGAQYTVLSGGDVVAEVNKITDGHGVDVIIDGVGKDTFEADLEIIALKGTLISFGNASGAVPPFSILKLGAKNVRLLRPRVDGYVSTREELEKYSSELFDFVASGKVAVNIHGVYPLAEAAKAQADIQSRKTTGKLLLKVD